MLQNIALATEALGLGGFPHYAAHRFAWLDLDRLRRCGTGPSPRSRTRASSGPLLMRLLDKNITIPQAVGLDHDGQPIIKPYAAPVLPDDGGRGPRVRRRQVRTQAPGSSAMPPGTIAWRDPAAVQAGIPRVHARRTSRPSSPIASDVMDRYGQFPANYGPFRTLMAFQAHHIDTAFYDQFYTDGAYTARTPGPLRAVAPRPRGDARVSAAGMTVPRRPGSRPSCTRSRTAGPTIDGHQVHYRRRGRGTAAPAAQRQPQLVVRMARRHPGPAGHVPLHRARLPGLRPVGRGARVRLQAGSQSRVIEALVDRLGLERPRRVRLRVGRADRASGFAGRRPELVRALVIGNTWAWPDDRLRVRLFSGPDGRPAQPAPRRSPEPDAAPLPAAGTSSAAS